MRLIHGYITAGAFPPVLPGLNPSFGAGVGVFGVVSPDGIPGNT